MTGIGLTAALAVAPASVMGAAATSQYERCINSGTSNPAWQACGSDEIDRQEARLNKAWKRALASCFSDSSIAASRHAKAALIEEEKLWIRWKDASCNFYVPQDASDGTGWAGREGVVLHMPMCRARIVTERAKYLEDLAEDCRPH